MIPYFSFSVIHLGPVTLQVWGIFVSLGIAAAVLWSYFSAKKHGLSGDAVLDMAIGVIFSGFVMARVFFVLFYYPEYFWAHPFDVFKIWQGGASSLGGFIGAGLAFWFYAKIKKLRWNDLLPYFDVIAPGFWLGWGIGRLGCFMIHDHIGRLSGSFLAVNFPSGARYDLGLLESILGFILFVFSILLFKKMAAKMPGLVAGATIAVYAVIRFGLDFLRASDLQNSDARYFYLTPAQWGMLVVLAGLTFAYFRNKISTRTKIGEVA
jgi:phosphatidylglycerol---prolipoprotein diacylglyceryl transferase